MRGSYRERAPSPDLRGELACTWTTQVGSAELALVPDACLDLLWLDDGRLVACGPETRAWRSSLPSGTQAAGVRFRPGVAPAALGVPAAALLNVRVPLVELWGKDVERIAEAVMDADGGAAKVRVLEGAVRQRLRGGPPADPVALELASRLARPTAGTRGNGVHGLADELGFSERQLLRRSIAAFGYGPSTLARILRLQRFLAIARTRHGMGLAALAAAAGYADQPHLSRECSALAAMPASVLVAQSAEQTSDPFTTGSAGAPTLPAPRRRSS